PPSSSTPWSASTPPVRRTTTATAASSSTSCGAWPNRPPDPASGPRRRQYGSSPPVGWGLYCRRPGIREGERHGCRGRLRAGGVRLVDPDRAHRQGDGARAARLLLG